jgi:hypothetical protein
MTPTKEARPGDVTRDLQALVERIAAFPSCADPLTLVVLILQANRCLDEHGLRTLSKAKGGGR